ncbi:MAG: hypothetical protein Q4B89_00925 [Lachnospiraceae bacterium]|nr:hypothetical protein [Lachnospiraceae bacterium]
MEKLNDLDLMLIEGVTNDELMRMERQQRGGEEINRQREFDLRMLRRKIELMRMQERENKNN